MKDLIEFFGRSSIALMLIYLMKEVFAERLAYNWSFALGALFLIIWIYLPFVKIKDAPQEESE